MRGTELTDEQWERIRPLLPRPTKGEAVRGPTTGRSSTRSCMCSGPGAAGRIFPGSKPPLPPAGGGCGNARGMGRGRASEGYCIPHSTRRGLEWSRAFLDGSFIPEKGGPAVGITKRGKGTKLMVVADGEELPIRLWWPAPGRTG